MNTFVMNGAPMNSFTEELPFVGENADKSFFAESGVNNWKPNVRATSFVVVIENKQAGGIWAIEGITGKIRDAGRRR